MLRVRFGKRSIWGGLGGVIVMVAVAGCYGGGGGAPHDPVLDMGLGSPPEVASKPAGLKNDDGMSHFRQGHFDTSTEFFQAAIKAAPDLAEAHFNLALALDQMGKHPEATEQFAKAKELAPNNPKITGNEILKKHTGA